jgi:hypothetical protein
MGSYEPVTERGWRTRAVRRLQRLADALGTEADSDADVAEAEIVDGGDDDPSVAELETVDVFDQGARAAIAAERKAASRRAEFRAVVKEVYPTVAPAIIALAEGGIDADLDEWLTVARLLYDDVTHRDGGLSAEARERALRAAAAQALEAQARSSARLAGYSDAEQDEISTIEGDPAGTLVWEHYLCREAKLVRENLHGETLGHWLSALGELWSAASLLYRLDSDAVAASEADLVEDAELADDPSSADPSSADPSSADPATATADTPVRTAVRNHVAAPRSTGGDEAPDHELARFALKAALTRVEELALW